MMHFFILQVYWYKLDKDSSDLIDISSDDKYTIHTNGSLSILDTQQGDEGTYRIEISNSAGKASEEIVVVLKQRAGS